MTPIGWKEFNIRTQIYPIAGLSNNKCNSTYVLFQKYPFNPPTLYYIIGGQDDRHNNRRGQGPVSEGK